MSELVANEFRFFPAVAEFGEKMEKLKEEMLQVALLMEGLRLTTPEQISKRVIRRVIETSTGKREEFLLDGQKVIFITEWLFDCKEFTVSLQFGR